MVYTPGRHGITTTYNLVIVLYQWLSLALPAVVIRNCWLSLVSSGYVQSWLSVVIVGDNQWLQLVISGYCWLRWNAGYHSYQQWLCWLTL